MIGHCSIATYCTMQYPWLFLVQESLTKLCYKHWVGFLWEHWRVQFVNVCLWLLQPSMILQQCLSACFWGTTGLFSIHTDSLWQPIVKLSFSLSLSFLWPVERWHVCLSHGCLHLSDMECCKSLLILWYMCLFMHGFVIKRQIVYCLFI